MDSIERLLAQVKAQYSETPAPPAAPSPLPPSSPPAKPTSGRQPDPLDSLLAEIKGQYEVQDAIAQEARQQQLVAEQQRQAQAQQARRTALARTAQDWLKNLDPLSTEGLWFNQFAEQYPSKLEAAIDYLAALEADQ
ncbi:MULTISPECIES: salt stress protein, Slr1339 family [Trichocoleus]|uniref:Uncharacterized protein n=1 Tax=Trichocoleus desertorum GB2-A4 TaxID=2933944 RepID=A0ABV0JBA8_9CYAN|nr:hypothetical protein [Trichocoleus sp. FACHB-46]MBD1860854.1 hypothetical protein [Trichocoleus sp. FACHB-46]